MYPVAPVLRAIIISTLVYLAGYVGLHTRIFSEPWLSYVRRPKNKGNQSWMIVPGETAREKTEPSLLLQLVPLNDATSNPPA